MDMLLVQWKILVKALANTMLDPIITTGGPQPTKYQQRGKVLEANAGQAQGYIRGSGMKSAFTVHLSQEQNSLSSKEPLRKTETRTIFWM